MSTESPSANAFTYPAYVKYLMAITAHSFAMQIIFVRLLAKGSLTAKIN